MQLAVPTPLSAPVQTGPARLAGALYLVIIVAGVWSEGFVRSSLLIPGDPASTATNVLANEALFRASFAADVVMAICDVALAVLMYVLLRPAGPVAALAATVFRLVQAAIIGMNLLHQQAVLTLLQTDLLPPEQANALALLTAGMHGQGYDLGLIFFGVNSLLVGWLLCRAGAPQSLAGGMLGAGAVYLVGSGLVFLAPGAAEAFQPMYLAPLVAESALCLWLLVKGEALERAAR